MTVTINGTTGVVVPNGSAGTPSLQGGSSTTGIYYGTNTVLISTSGANAVTVDSSGNVNIGTSGVSAQLYVNKNAAGAISAIGSTSGTITLDFSTANNFSFTLTGTATLANPTNLTAGQSGVIYVTQGGSGSYTMSYGTYWDFPGGVAPTLTTTVGAVDVITYSVKSTTSIAYQLLANIG